MKQLVANLVLLLSACSAQAPLAVTVDDAGVELPTRRFPEHVLPTVATPDLPVPPVVSQFGRCMTSDGTAFVCNPFPVRLDEDCGAGEMHYPTAPACTRVAPCLDRHPQVVGSIYVDATAPAGGDGTSERPYQSIQAGIDAAPENGNVRVQNGRYAERITIDRGISVQGACPERTILGMETPAPTSQRYIVELRRGSLSTMTIHGNGGSAESNWGGIGHFGGHAEVSGVILERLAYSIYSEAGTLQISDIKGNSMLSLHDTADVEAERVDIDLRQVFQTDPKIAVLCSGNVRLVSRDLLIRAPLPEGNENTLVILGENGSPWNGTASFEDVAILSPLSNDYGWTRSVLALGQGTSSWDRVYVAVDIGFALFEEQVIEISHAAAQTPELLIHFGPNAPKLDNINVQWRPHPTFIDFVAATAAGIELRSIWAKDFSRGLLAIEDGVRGDAIVEDLLFEGRLQLSPGFVVYAEKCRVRRAQISNSTTGVGCVEVAGEDLVVSGTDFGVMGRKVELSRARLVDIRRTGVLVRSDIAGEGAPESTSLVARDISLARVPYGLVAFQAASALIERANVVGITETAIELVYVGNAYLKDLFIVNFTPSERVFGGQELSVGILGYGSMVNVDGLLLGPGPVETVGISLEQSPFTGRRIEIENGFAGIVINDDSFLRLSETAIADVPTGVWFAAGTGDTGPLREVSFFNVLRPVSSEVLEVPLATARAAYDLTGITKPQNIDVPRSFVARGESLRSPDVQSGSSNRATGHSAHP